MQENKEKNPVWKKKRPKAAAKAKFKLSPEQIEEVRERAAKAGRRYPNLVDNMWVAKKYKLIKEILG